MDAARSSSSNVTVEYTDPFGLFNSIKPLLSDVLPLRNLHWKSHTRPLRSIDSLHIDFVPAHNAADEQKRLSDGAVSQRRRHQIPGLRQTPYLKIYLLRCDDNEVYKTTSRKQVREWIKTRASPPQSSSAATQDNHDAFEWLIIHAVPPGADVQEKAPASKWPGQKSTSVLEKVKADFNGSSKSAVDRVVQLRLPKPEAERKSPELSAQLDDLVTKLKSSILTSFDLRVSQYEDDIREKDSQRSLPGWNFCTFFILKEGLSLGFENVGLFEDALVGYDELSFGLDAALRDRFHGAGDQHGGTFLGYSKDVKSKAETLLSVGGGDGSEEDRDSDDQTDDGSALDRDPIGLDPDEYPLDANRKPYREMILANNISIFDFRAYIFSRQLVLLLKAAKALSIRKDKPRNSQGQTKGPEDLTLLSEICQRASEFIPLCSHILRHDLQTGLAQSQHEHDEASKTEIIDNMVSSWIYSAVSQVLIQTSAPAVRLPNVSLQSTRDLVNASIVAPFVESRPGIPKRSSSLLPMTPTSSKLPGQEIISGGRAFARPPLSSLKGDDSTSEKTGATGLVSCRGDLYFLARSTLDNLGRKRKWGQGWRDLSLLYFEEDESAQLTQISLDDDDEKPRGSGSEKELIVQPDGVDGPMSAAIKSSKAFDIFYEKITDQIFCHYIAANKTRSAELALADMALLKYRTGDYSAAASYFHQLTTFYAESKWEALEGATLELYGRSLKQLNRNEEYVHALLKLLGLYAGTARTESRSMTQTGRFSSLVPSSFSTATRDKVSGYVGELCESSCSLSKEVTVQLADFFGSIAIDPRIRHFEDRDGFQVQLSLRFVLGESIKLDGVKMRLVNASDPENSELWLEKEGDVTVKSSPTRILLDSPATVEGKYLVDHFEVRMGNIIFVRRYRFENEEPVSLQEIMTDTTTDKTPPSVMCYPPAEGFEAKITSSHMINLGDLRTVEVEVKSGWNDIVKGDLRLKPATAGLRLLVADVSVVRGSLSLSKKASSGHIEFENLEPNSSATLSIPYTVEGSHSTLLARLEVSYETPHGHFSYASTSWITSTLPVSVNVQDIFKNEVLFSKFTISPTTMIPIRLLGCQMASPQAYDVRSSMRRGEVFDVFPKQPASLLYKIRQRGDDESGAGSESSSSRTLRLTIEFACVNEESLAVLETRFIEDISSSPFRSLTRLLLPHLLETFNAQWTAKDLETIGLTREIEMLPSERFQWRNVTRTIGGELERQVTEWLRTWHENNQSLRLPPQTPSTARRRILIPVDIPEIQVVHTAELVLPHTTTSTSGTSHWAVGTMIPAELHLRHTRRWCPPAAREPQSDLSFAYEVLANPDLWLVGGRRRGNFTATQSQGEEGCVFEVMLLPQRAGYLMLPSVDVKTFGPPAAGGGGTTATATATATATEGEGDSSGPVSRRVIASEVDYKNHGETVLVSPDLGKTTVSLGVASSSDAQGAGGWLVASERRKTPRRPAVQG